MPDHENAVTLPPLQQRLQSLAVEYHKSPEGEGEYGCNGLACPGVQRLIGFAKRCAGAAIAEFINFQAEALVASPWRPISTPPPRGPENRVLFRGVSKAMSFSHAAVVDGWIDSTGEPVHDYHYKLVITHWMPMPPKPEVH